MNTPIFIPMTVSADAAAIPMAVAVDTVVLQATVGAAIVARPVPDYLGPYEFTPTQGTQTAAVANTRATRDIIINPIPSNYGLITWNGATLTVS